jgi:drug/metabolite transporter (DMT)-like permease
VVLFRLGERDRPPLATLAGVAVGFVGLAILVLPGDRPGDAPLWGVLTIIAAAALWATGSYYSKRMTLPEDPFVSTTHQMLIGGGSMLLAALPAGEYANLDVGNFSGDSWLALAYLIVIGGMVAYAAYTWLLQNAPISTVATYAYVNPVIAVFLGWAILDEEVTAAVAAGAVLIVASVATVVRRESGVPARVRKRPPEPEPARP